MHGKTKLRGINQRGSERKNRTKKRYKTFQKYSAELLEETSVVGIAPILKAKGWPRKSLKVVLLACGLAGFLFQSYEFLTYYWQYSTISSISNMDVMKKPALTICDENLIRRKYLCDTQPDLCGHILDIDEVFGFESEYDASMAFYPYCLDPEDIYLIMPKQFIVSYENASFFDLNFTRESGFQIEDSLVSCRWIDYALSEDDLGASSTVCSKPKFIRGIDPENLPGACYILESNRNGNNYTQEILTRDVILRITLRWRTSDLNNIGPDIGSISNPPPRVYYISFHHPGQLSNPFEQGIRILGGKHYRMHVLENDYIRLPPPYTSACYDYVRDWENNGGSGPLRKEECYKKCKVDASFGAFGCVPKHFSYPHEKKLCTERLQFDRTLNVKIQKCLLACRKACFERRYIAEAEITGEISPEDAKSQYGSVSAVTLEVDFNILKSRVSTDKPKYESVELFSYIGGYLGMWLGWSLVAICDFF